MDQWMGEEHEVRKAWAVVEKGEEGESVGNTAGRCGDSLVRGEGHGAKRHSVKLVWDWSRNWFREKP